MAGCLDFTGKSGPASSIEQDSEVSVAGDVPASSADSVDDAALADTADAATDIGVPPDAGEPACMNPLTDCPTPDSSCSAYVCAGGECKLEPLAVGTLCGEALCREPACDGAGACVEGSVTEGAACQTGDPCLGGGRCDAFGACLEKWNDTCACTDASDCDDQLDCTEGICDDGTCTHTVNENYCVINDVCYPTGATNPDTDCLECQPSASPSDWSAVSCDDDNPCTDDSCGSLGCNFVHNQQPCDDGEPCNGDDDVCANGMCGIPCVTECIQADDCSDFAGAPAISACQSYACEAFTCIVQPNPSADGDTCDTGDPCAVDGTCNAGTCSGSSPCAATPCKGLCVAGADGQSYSCTPGPTDAGSSCDDGSACTSNDICDSDGTCDGDPLDCSMFDVSCGVGACAPATGTCYVEPVADGTACPNGSCDTGVCTPPDVYCDDVGDCADPGCASLSCNQNACTVLPFADYCLIDGECYQKGDVHPTNKCLQCSPQDSNGSWSVLTCNADNPCAPETCDPNQGCVVSEDTTGKPCTIDGCPISVCQALTCVSQCECLVDEDCTETPEACQKIECDDNFKCAAFKDDTQDGAPCDDGSFCFVGETCIHGYCTAQGKADCSSLDNQCNTGECNLVEDACEAVPRKNGIPCTNTFKCDVADRCKDGSCQGFPVDCGEDTPCISFFCDPSTGQCMATIGIGQPGQDVWCDDFNDCTSNDLCNDDKTCAGQWDPSECPCSVDADCAAFADTDSCTTATCNADTGVCTFASVNGPCSDGDACTTGDVCSQGVCSGAPVDCDDNLLCTEDACDPDTGQCTNTLSEGWCFIDGDCYLDTQRHPTNPCQQCDSLVDANSWTNNDSLCDDGDSCTFGDVCTGGSCIGGGPTVCELDGIDDCATSQCDGEGGCTVIYSPGVCGIEGEGCFLSGAPHPSVVGLRCCPELDPASWTVLDSGEQVCPDS